MFTDFTLYLIAFICMFLFKGRIFTKKTYYQVVLDNKRSQLGSRYFSIDAENKAANGRLRLK